MPTSLKCPNCNASLRFSSDQNQASIHCDYCNSTVIIPEELRPNKAKVNASDQLKEAEALRQVVTLVQHGRKIQAIKLFRETFSVGLREAKEVIDALERQETIHLGGDAFTSQTPYDANAVQVKTGGCGCLGWLVLTTIAFVIGFVALGATGNLARFENAQIDRIVEQINTAIGSVEPTPVPQPEQAEQIAAQIAKAITEHDPTISDIEQLTDEIAEALANNEQLDIEIIAILEQAGAESLLDETTLSEEMEPDFISLRFGGGEGVGPGFFNDTRRLDLDGSGNIYTGDYSGGRIQVFDNEGNFLRQINVGEELYMTGMAVDRLGTVYVVPFQGVERYDGTTGASLGTLTGTEGIRFDAVGSTVDGGIVAIGEERLMRYDMQGNLTLEVAYPYAALADFRTTHNDLAVDGAGNIYMLGSETILKFDSNGRFVDQIGSMGDALDQFYISPTALAVDGRGFIYANDFDGIKVFDNSGRFLRLIESPGVTFDMAVTDSDQLVVMDRNSNEVRVYELGLIFD